MFTQDIYTGGNNQRRRKSVTELPSSDAADAVPTASGPAVESEEALGAVAEGDDRSCGSSFNSEQAKEKSRIKKHSDTPHINWNFPP